MQRTTFLDHLDGLDNDTTLLLAISGGPDSVYMVNIVKNWYIKECLDLSNLVLVYYNHTTIEKLSGQELFIKDIFPELTIVSASSIGSDKREGVLRNERWDFFISVMKSFNTNIILTGHNLSDRLETTIINLERGASLKGFVNMQCIDVRQVYGFTYSIVRPLLHLTKDEILEQCKNNSLKYNIDPTNIDPDFSYRNIVRERINKSVGGDKVFFDRLDTLYSKFSSVYSDYQSDIIPLIHSQFWLGVNQYVSIDIPKSRHELTVILSTLGIYKGTTKARLDAIIHIINHTSDGHISFGGWTIFRAHDRIYLFDTDRNFYDIYIDHSILITEEKVYTFGDFTWKISSDRFGGLLRFPKRGDKFGSKSLTKYFINKKIPIFRRKYIPVIEKEGVIIEVLPKEYLEGKI